MNNGFIQLHRKVLDWEWYSDSNTVRLFFHCILKANFKTKKWMGKIINTGEFITSYPHLAEELNLTVQQIRTSLNKLKSTGEITVKTSNKNSLIQVVNYNNYQLATDRLTDKQQTNNSQITTTNKDNKDNNIYIPTGEPKSEIMKKLEAKEPLLKPKKIPFENFYKLYPVKKSKRLAETKWNRLDLTTQEKCIKVLESNAYREWLNKQEIKYVKHPSTWLNQGCWDDELETNKNSSPDSSEARRKIMNGENKC